MLQRSVIGLVILLSVMPIVLATDTTITVDTWPLHDVTISVLRAGDQYYSLQSFIDQPSGEAGQVTVTYTGAESEINIAVYLKVAGQTISYKKFDGFATGEPIVIEFPENNDTEDVVPTTSSSDEPEETNESVVKNSEVEESVESNVAESNTPEETNAKVTGYSISEEGSSNVRYYVIVGVLVAMTITAFVFGRMRRNKLPLPGRKPTTKQPEPVSKSNAEDISASIRAAEERIKESQKQLSELRRSSQIAEVEKRLAQDQQELERLRFDNK